MTPAPAISVVLPTHNRAGLLPRALASVLAQTCDEAFEVIVIDDGSGDGTAAYLAAIADPRLKVLRNETAQGAAAARNRGLAAAGAPVTAFLDDDDELLPGFLTASLTAHRQAPVPDLCWTGVLYALPDGREEVERWERWSGSQHFVIRLAGCCGISFRTEALRGLGGFDPAFAISEDTDLFMRLVEAGGSWRCLPQPLIKVHAQSDASLSRSADAARHIDHLQRLIARHRHWSIPTLPSGGAATARWRCISIAPGASARRGASSSACWPAPAAWPSRSRSSRVSRSSAACSSAGRRAKIQP